MFNNANVIFRTKFVDGSSTVRRTLGRGTSTAETFADVAIENASTAASKKGNERAAAKKKKKKEKTRKKRTPLAGVQ